MLFFKRTKESNPVKRKIRKRRSVYMEYAMLAALVGIVGATAIVVYGKELKEFFTVLAKKAHETTKAINTKK